jgi:hypothetical protein
MTVYASAVIKPGHGNTAPLAIGLSLYAAAISGLCVWRGDTHTHMFRNAQSLAHAHAPMHTHMQMICTCPQAHANVHTQALANAHS